MGTNSGASLWFDALFELSWQMQPSSALFSKRYVWQKNCSIQLNREGLFPHLPASIPLPPAESFPHENGCPLVWYAQLVDVTRASVAAIDEILERENMLTNSSGKRFKIGLSFPGERRDFVKAIAERLSEKFGKPQVLYDKFHEAEFAQPNLDIFLPNLYRNQCELIAVFLGKEYSMKRWCKLEWRLIRQLIETTDSSRIMLLSFDQNGALDELGIVAGDGYVSIESRPPAAITELILERIQLNERLASVRGPKKLPD